MLDEHPAMTAIADGLASVRARRVAILAESAETEAQYANAEATWRDVREQAIAQGSVPPPPPTPPDRAAVAGALLHLDREAQQLRRERQRVEASLVNEVEALAAERIAEVVSRAVGPLAALTALVGETNAALEEVRRVRTAKDATAPQRVRPGLGERTRPRLGLADLLDVADGRLDPLALSVVERPRSPVMVDRDGDPVTSAPERRAGFVEGPIGIGKPPEHEPQPVRRVGEI